MWKLVKKELQVMHLFKGLKFWESPAFPINPDWKTQGHKTGLIQLVYYIQGVHLKKS